MKKININPTRCFHYFSFSHRKDHPNKQTNKHTKCNEKLKKFTFLRYLKEKKDFKIVFSNNKK